jgi:prepilin-type N-terminal cleavage/methylation domain-containing protein
MQKFKMKSMCNQQGFSLVEIVVSIFVFALISLALLPVLITAMQMSSNNASLTSATHIASERMNLVRSQSPTCAAITAFASVAVPDIVLPDGMRIRTTQVAGPCPVAYPGVVPFEVNVFQLGTDKQLAEASTLVFVESAS